MPSKGCGGKSDAKLEDGWSIAQLWKPLNTIPKHLDSSLRMLGSLKEFWAKEVRDQSGVLITHNGKVEAAQARDWERPVDLVRWEFKSWFYHLLDQWVTDYEKVCFLLSRMGIMPASSSPCEDPMSGTESALKWWLMCSSTLVVVDQRKIEPISWDGSLRRLLP